MEEKTYRLTFARNLKRIMWEKDTTQTQLAIGCGFKYTSVISKYANGVHVPSIDAAAKIADFLGVSLDQLVGREERYG